MGKYSILANAIRQAVDFGLNVYDLETGNLVFEHATTRKEQFIAQLREMDRIAREDIKNGHQWLYSNKTSKKASNFDQARKQGKYYVNCCDGCHWGMKRMTPAINACSWFGAKGGSICWCSKTAEKDTRKYFDIIQTDCKKTVRQLVNNGTIQAGDILTYVNMSHTNAYLGDGQSFDTGSGAYTKGHSGENAVFTKWIGKLSCAGQKVGCILRLKEQTVGFRVQVGAYTTKEKIAEAQKLCKELGFDTFTEAVDGATRVFCGSFTVLDNAIERLGQVQTVKLFEKAYIKGI